MAIHEEHEEHENHERWLVSYADFITLLFAFFVVMYAVSQVDQQRAIQVEQAVKWALHIEGDGGSGVEVLERGVLTSSPGPEGMPNETARAAMKSKLKRRERKMANAKASGRPSVLVFSEGQRLVVRVNALGLFDQGGSAILPSAIPVLDVALRELAEVGGTVRVEGHTDNVGSRGAYDQNWALSAARAASVVAYAQATRSVSADRLELAAFGASRPIADNTTITGLALTRRLELAAERKTGKD